MTFAINAPTHRRRSHGASAARGFTLIELLLVIGILAVLMGLLLPAVAKTYSRAIRIRTQADLQTITTALEAYKSDFGVYPPVTSENAGAAVLGKALLGPADAAHYYTPATPPAVGLVANDALQNLPETYLTSKTYQAGDVVLSGAQPTFDSFSTGVPAVDIFVCVRNNTQADGTPRTPGVAPDNWWSRFVPFDGNDGNGVKIRMSGVSGGLSGLPHAAAGKVYGPYLDVQRFRSNGTAILDRNDMPILYFPLNTSLRAGSNLNPGPAAAAPSVTVLGPNSYANESAMPAGTPLPIINERDNRGAFVNDGITPTEPAATLQAKMRVTLGDYNSNGLAQLTAPVPELDVPSVPFLLWTAGPDKRFGPTGQLNPPSYTRGDFYSTAANATENQATAIAVDDVTNFRP